MSIATISLKYGWWIVAGAVLTGATIYVASNAPTYLYQRDVVEIVLGVTERCLATQITTNPTYSVTPPSFVRTWTTTNGLTGTNFAWVTQTVTNTLSWYSDRSMMVDLDAKIKTLCPYYVDTNSVYDGTTNIVMCTFTGLLTSLDLGDHTNFTSTPAIGTNAATFGPWAWRNYIVAWQERYKVLNALKMMPLGYCTGTNFGISNGAQISADSYWYSSTNAVAHGLNNLGPSDGTVYDIIMSYKDYWLGSGDYVWFGFSGGPMDIGGASYDILFYMFVQAGVNQSAKLTLLDSPSVTKIWNAAFRGEFIGNTNAIISVSHTASEVNVGITTVTDDQIYADFNIWGTVTPQFSYCTNKYW